MEVFIHEDYVNKRREQRRRRRRPAVVLLQVVPTSSPEKGRLPPASPPALQESPWDQPIAAASPSASVGSPPAGPGTASSFADHLLGYL
ncbi:hypothetical protein ABZP36_022130 [Zizania latifolia]